MSDDDASAAEHVDGDGPGRVPLRRPTVAERRQRALAEADVPVSEPLPRRPPYQLVVLLVIGAVFGAVATLTWRVAPSARTVAGTVAAIDDTGSAMLLEGVDDLADVGLGLVGTTWRDVGPGEETGEWQRQLSDEGFPTCLTPQDEGRQVRLGLVTDPGGNDRPPAEVVAWIECAPRS